jgi:esterase/lipase
MFFNKKSPKIAAMAAPVYALTKKKKISLYITYLQDDKVYTSDYHYEVATNNAEEMDKNSKKIREDLRLIVDDIYKQLNDKSSEYIYIKDQSFILNKKDFLNCNVVIKDITE